MWQNAASINIFDFPLKLIIYWAVFLVIYRYAGNGLLLSMYLFFTIQLWVVNFHRDVYKNKIKSIDSIYLDKKKEINNIV